MKQMSSMTAISRLIVLLSVPLFACGEKVPNAPEPAVVQPVAPVVAQAPATPVISPDADLESQLKKALAGDPVLGALGIDVMVVNGVARLWGTVRIKSDKRKAVALMRANEHVIVVNDNLVVVSGS